MSLLTNIRHLEKKPLHLAGELSLNELDVETLDELIRLDQPLRYEIEVQLLNHSLLVRGCLTLELQCDCVRCLKPYPHVLKLEDWACHIELEGDDKALVINDCVDLTPYVREDIVLAFPQHPLCSSDCSGLVDMQKDPEKSSGAASESGSAASAWSALDKLKL
jgi:uncharacterized protein